MIAKRPMDHELRTGDVTWALRRMVFKVASNTLPVGAHFRLAWLRGRIHRQINGVPGHVRNNLATVLGDFLEPSELDAIARNHVEFLGRSYLTGLLPELNGFNDSGRWRVEGLRHLDNALTRGKGAFLATAHLGYARMIGPVLRAKGYDAKRVVAKSLNHVDRDSRWKHWLESGGSIRNRIAPLVSPLLRTDDISAQLDIRPILLELSRNKPIMVAGDGFRAAEFVMLPFLGRTNPFATGFMKIALMTGAAVLPCFVLEEEGDHRIRVEVKQELDLVPGGTIEENLLKFVKVLDEQIRCTPHLWYRWSIENTFEKAEKWTQGGAQDRWNQTFKSWVPD